MVRRLKLGLKILIVCVILAAAYGAHKYEWLQKTVHWVESFGRGEPLVFFGIYVLTSILFMPSIFFSFAGGFLFGIVGGTALSVVGIATGATIAFLIGRYIARSKVENYCQHYRKFQLIDHAIHKKGWKVILLARLTPIFPFLIANYGFGLTQLKVRHYFMASLIGSIPGTAVIVYAGSLAGSLNSADRVSAIRTPAEWLILIVGLACTMILAWYMKRFASQALRKDIAS